MVQCFQESREDIQDDAMSGNPSTSVVPSIFQTESYIGISIKYYSRIILKRTGYTLKTELILSVASVLFD